MHFRSLDRFLKIFLQMSHLVCGVMICLEQQLRQVAQQQRGRSGCLLGLPCLEVTLVVLLQVSLQMLRQLVRKQ